jgi:hypothetical protein
MSGMVSTCERSLLLVVTSNKLKMLKSLSQKALWQEGGRMPPPSWTPNATGKQSGSNPPVLLMQNMVSPFSSEGSVDSRKVRQWESG